MFKIFSIGVLAMLLSACSAPRPHHVMPQNLNESVTAPSAQPSGRFYRVDESQSELRILVYKAGPLARFGHNHVIVNHAIHGTVNVGTRSVFWLNVPIVSFVVDDAEARREEGPDFSAEVSEDAKSGTSHNMLSAAVLNADEFPVITINSVAVSGTPDASGNGALTATVAISVAGHESRIDVPFTLKNDSHNFVASGSLELRQSRLGLVPYSLMLGALQVEDAMVIKFKLVAIPS